MAAPGLTARDESRGDGRRCGRTYAGIPTAIMTK
jgi:hypothetical protein